MMMNWCMCSVEGGSAESRAEVLCKAADGGKSRWAPTTTTLHLLAGPGRILRSHLLPQPACSSRALFCTPLSATCAFPKEAADSPKAALLHFKQSREETKAAGPSGTCFDASIPPSTGSPGPGQADLCQGLETSPPTPASTRVGLAGLSFAKGELGVCVCCGGERTELAE